MSNPPSNDHSAVAAAPFSNAASLSNKEARRIALTAQGFAPAEPKRKRHDRRHLDLVLDKVGLLQIDSVNVLARAHYLPLFSRLGPYATDILDKAAFAPEKPGAAKKNRRLFEYWAHEASLLPFDVQPLLRWRMERAYNGDGVWKRIAEYARANPDQITSILKQVTDRGPIKVSDLDEKKLQNGQKRDRAWWGWDDCKQVMEWLFWTGQVTAAGRQNFERLYDLPERVLPDHVAAAPTPSQDEAQRGLLRIASRALGVASEPDLRDYFRLSAVDSKQRVAELAEAGDLIPVTIEGWDQPAFLDPSFTDLDTLPRRIHSRALLSPFDSLVWDRPRTERLFGFRYRLEIYTPEHKRRHGYYVLPFLLGNQLVARVDLKADRQSGCLKVQASHAEKGAKQGAVASALYRELQSMAHWLGLERIEIRNRGDLAAALKDAAEVRSS
ncbi:winged helix-turn-helix domain-containing protein [Pelagibius sp. Alg239-R121]|uniref:winged helix-turn-helix domain-containing protein n=1 Tax=Pelagibius sp. Alg239-R121 TaxID=2993448 RepID=UPI0024A75AC3|nr:winged helix-turn-helix domain-containing protein [Pelagibius sp. Alg239-R121]